MNLAKTIFFSILMLGGIIGLTLIVTLTLGLAPTNVFIVILLFIFAVFIIIGLLFAALAFTRERNDRRC